jgi:hypothetical protein
LNPIANQLDTPQFHRFCRALIEQYVDLLQMLTHEGAILRIVGMAGSPSCGVIATSSGYTDGLPGAAEHTHARGRGVFMEVLLARGAASLRIVGATAGPGQRCTDDEQWPRGLPRAAEHESASGRGCFMGMLLAELDWRRIEILNN